MNTNVMKTQFFHKIVNDLKCRFMPWRSFVIFHNDGKTTLFVRCRKNLCSLIKTYFVHNPKICTFCTGKNIFGNQEN